MSDASGNRLLKSGKIIVTSVDLKVQDAKTKRFRTFRPTFEVADLGIDEMVILGYDWISETTERIVVGPPGGLEFKSPIQEITSETEEFTNVIRECKWGSGLLKSRLCFLTSKKHKQDYQQRGPTTWC